MTHNSQKLLDLLGSRICHDLISPIGAISNGVELLTMDRRNLSPEIELIAESVENANARIRFFRVAYGAARDEQKIGTQEVQSILRDMTRGGKTVIEWQPEGDVMRLHVKLVFLLLQCFETATPWGGKITISKIGTQWAVYAEAEKMNVDIRLWETLTGSKDETSLDAAQIQFALAPMVAGSMGRRLTLECSENSARVRF